eukprot:CAMPEP_0194129504 /NCGR_PEP_ID=MMETSP0152-20130528/707_1 /TAXON_ID=1049557 /ORGANISM="Thalassiothrix antarctica, Strain L6-D1" /LENGTH=395 /DNA_ID=CAMNT_0038823709 /DNA_START=209 /DNA_END=1396 /DNA_ORIENTATION=-
MAVPIVSDWKVLKTGELVGSVKNHPVIENGDVIRTSPLQNAEGATERSIVQTVSGSKYRLGSPSAAQQKLNKKEKALVSSLNSNKVLDKGKLLTQAYQKAKNEFQLTGKVIGNGSYLLSGRSSRSTSGKSSILTCYRSDGNGLPVGDALCAKLSPNLESLRREASNYEKVTRGLTRGKFVNFVTFYGRASDDDKTMSKQGAIIMEQGMMDCKSYLEQNGALEGKELRNVFLTAVQCLQAVHSANLVWTDMKCENFVVTNLDPLIIKGIDLESAMPTKDNPVDYSPEACPPEFAESFLAGIGPYFILETSYDVWSMGMMLYELATGTTFYGNKSPSQITKILKSPNFTPNTSKVTNDNLRNLIDSCLQINPKKRPSLTQILLHPYFITTGIGPFSF